jgi:hypothetical protein
MLGVAVTTAGSTGTGGWRDILIPGAQPDRASGHVYGSMNPFGYGTDKLCGVKRSLEPAVIVRVMLDAWRLTAGLAPASGTTSLTFTQPGLRCSRASQRRRLLARERFRR